MRYRRAERLRRIRNAYERARIRIGRRDVYGRTRASDDGHGEQVA
jgi:hypothetical protein